MPLTDLVAQSAIIPALRVNGKKQAMQEIAAKAAELPEDELRVPGSRKFAWLKILKNSARNCSFHRSLIGMFLAKFTSKFNIPGPLTIPLPTLPNVPIAGRAKALGLM